MIKESNLNYNILFLCVSLSSSVCREAATTFDIFQNNFSIYLENVAGNHIIVR